MFKFASYHIHPRHNLTQNLRQMENSPFGKLVGELRNKIYELVLYEPRGFHFHKAEKGDQLICYYPASHSYPYAKRSSIRRDWRLALTEVCKEIRKESCPLFYAINTFYVNTRVWHTEGRWTTQQGTVYRYHLGVCRRWLRQIGSNNAAAIRKLKIGSGTWQAWRLTAKGNTKWWHAARAIERKLLSSTLRPNAIYVAITFDFGKEVDINSRLRSSPERNPHPHCYLNTRVFLMALKSMTISIPTDNKLMAWRKAEKDFAKRAKKLRSHEYHGCGVAALLPELLRGLEACRASFMRALRAPELLNPEHDR